MFKNNVAFCSFSQNFDPFYVGPFYPGPNSVTLQKLKPLRAGVIKADKVSILISVKLQKHR